MGTDVADCGKVAELIGVKLFLTEFVAYENLGTIIENNEIFAAYNGSYVETHEGLFLEDMNKTLVGGVLQVNMEYYTL